MTHVGRGARLMSLGRLPSTLPSIIPAERRHLAVTRGHRVKLSARSVWDEP
jgi:hypothetical protein